VTEAGLNAFGGGVSSVEVLTPHQISVRAALTDFEARRNVLRARKIPPGVAPTWEFESFFYLERN
jgi:hypothetical protein